MNSNNNHLPALLNVKTAAEVMGVSRDFVYKALKAGDLPTQVIAGKRWVLRDPLLRQLGIITDQPTTTTQVRTA